MRFEYSGGLNTEHPKSEHIIILNVLKVGFGMVRIWSGWNAIAIAMVPTTRISFSMIAAN